MIIADERRRSYLDHSRRRRTRGKIRSWDQVVRRSRPESQQHPPMFLPGDRLGLHRDQDRAVLTVPSHEIHVFLRKRNQDDKTTRFTVTSYARQLAAISGSSFRNSSKSWEKSWEKRRSRIQLEWLVEKREKKLDLLSTINFHQRKPAERPKVRRGHRESI